MYLNLLTGNSGKRAQSLVNTDARSLNYDGRSQNRVGDQDDITLMRLLEEITGFKPQGGGSTRRTQRRLHLIQQIVRSSRTN